MILIDYRPSKGCRNEQAFYTCRKCELCGRKFDGSGFMTEEAKCQKKRKADTRRENRRKDT